MSNYWQKKMDELEEKEKKKKKKSTSSNAGITTDYWQSKMTELEKEQKRKSTQTASSLPGMDKIRESKLFEQTGWRAKQEEDIAPVQEERKWFDTGAFDDGYQFGDVVKTILGTGRNIGENLVTGVVRMGEKTLDAGMMLGAAMNQSKMMEAANNEIMFNVLTGKKNSAEKTFSNYQKMQDDVEKGAVEFVKQDLYDEKEVAKTILFSDAVTSITGIDPDKHSILGEKSESLVQSAGQLGATAALQEVGVPWWLTTGATSFGAEAENALNQGATFEEANLSATISAGAEILTEKLSGGIKFGGKTLDDLWLKPLTEKISSKVVRSLVNVGVDAVGEGTEEIISQVFSNLGSSLYREEDIGTILFSEEALDEYAESFVGGMVLGGFGSDVQAIKSGKSVKLTENEQKVVEKVYENRIAEEEQGGKKLTKAEKNEIYDKVLKDMEKGYISTDTIEEVLGGETYKSYKDTVDSEDALQAEFDALNKMKQGEMTGEQIDRRNELKQQLKDLETTSQRNQLKTQLGENVLGMVKGDRLAESYNERTRRTQAFEADLTKYDAKQQATIKKAVESGILNNTNRTHEFVDMIAKISADKGVLFDFTNNEKLKSSGFAVDGKSVNGYVTKDGVTLNIDSSKSLNSVTGHEITHILEGTELYTELQNTLFDYAKSKGEYDSRLANLTELYKNVKDADINAELTADLVGDYLFTDTDFIKKLSVENRNVFQKIYDEIKYLCKVATAGSKEARELEKVKKAFADAYRAGSKASGDTKYSIGDKNIKDISTGYASGETYYTMSYTQDGKVVAALEYGEYDGNPNVKMIEVEPEYRRKGIATKLLQELQKKYPDTEIDFGMTTPDGTKLLDSITYDVTDEAVVADRQKLKDLQSELNELQEKLDILYDTENLTEEQEAELHKLGDRWTEVYDSIRELSEELKGKKAKRTYVKTDAKYSISDTDGKRLTKEQQEYFKDSKMRDENGNLKVMYHGSQDAGFHIFDANMSDDDTSFFFVDRNDVAASYSGTTETYEAKTIRSAEDMNNFLAEIGYDEDYSVTEKDGKFELIYDGDKVASSDTAQGIYEEFCWYEGVGEGDANYKVYLNLTNPLVVDGKGRPWNKIDAEFSQEVYDKYNSLTAEEKAALVDLAGWEDFRIFNSEIQEASGNELASAYEKMGEDVNIYDLFSVAADNFSEEAMRENARKYLKTRDYAQRAKKQGYDGVIFNNIVDNGGYSNGSEGASTVAIAFNSNQIKSVANEKPTADPDIRYSLSTDSQGRELSKEQADYFKDSKAVDNDGKLAVVYHGTRKADFTQFKRNATYFTDSKEMADSYSPNGEMYEGYVNITKPYEIDAAGEKWSKIPIDDATKDFLREYGASVFKEGGKWRTTPADIVSAIEEAIDNGDMDYDGIIIRNIDDTGSYYKNKDSHLATDYIVFNSNQFKNADNTKPTSDPDIRYSLSEYTDEQKAEHNKAVVDYFGKTYRWSETGYVLLDGTRLDLSGRHEGGPGGYRSVDHRDIVDALGSDYGDGSYSGSLIQFMSEGNIRISPESDGINLSVKPNKAQETALASFIQNAHGEVILDIDDANGYTVVSVEYPSGTSAFKVLNDIRGWFDNGTKPEMPNNPFGYSLSEKGKAPKAYGRNNVYGKDIALAPVAEENTATASKTEGAAPVVSPKKETPTNATVTQEEMQELFPDNLAPVQGELSKLLDEQELLYMAMENALDVGTAEDVERLAVEYDALAAKIRELEAEDAERVGTLDDSNAPPEMEAPYYGKQDVSVDDPFANRDWYDAKHLTSIMVERPELKHFFQEEAANMLWDLSDTQKAERWYNDRLYYESGGEKGFGGSNRLTSDDIAEMLDSWHLSYDAVERGLNAIVKGEAKTAVPKKIEFMINRRLLHGYKDFHTGKQVPPNQAYIDALYEAQVNEQAGEAFDSFMETADQYAPVVEENSVTPKTTDEAPVAEQYETIRPKPQKEPRMARATPEEMADHTEQKTAKMVRREQVKPKRISNWDWAREHIFSHGAVIEDISLATGNRELQARFDMIRRADSRAQTLIGKGNKSQNVAALLDIKKSIEDAGKDEAFHDYMYYLLNTDRMTLEDRYGTPNKAVFGDEVTAAESQSAADALLANNPEFKQAEQQLYGIAKFLREEMVNAGLMSMELANVLEEMYPHYVPIRRVGHDGANVNVPLDTNKTGVNTPIKRAKGGNSDMYYIFDAMGEYIEQVYKAIARNRFGVELKNTLGTTIESDVSGVDEVLDGVENHEKLLQEGKNGKKPTFTVFENGEKVTFEITEEIYDALKPSQFTGTIAAFNKIGNIRRDMLTTYSPSFPFTNPFKDIGDIIVNSQHPARTYANIPEAIKQIVTNGNWYQERMEHGGEQDSYFDSQTKTFKKEKSKLGKIVGFPFEKIKAANEFIEQVPRMAEYIASRKMGRSIDVAMLDAARVTTNFGAAGDFTNMLNRNGVTFLGASVEGFNQQVRNVREAKAEGLKGWGKLAAKYAIAGLPALLLNHALWDDDEDYEELSDYVKQNYYVVAKFKDGTFLRIPKGRAVAVIQNAFEQMENLITGNDEVDLATFADLFFTNLAPNDPLDNNILSPIAQVASNKTWYGEDLVPTRLQDLPAAEQYDESTDAISRWLGEKTDGWHIGDISLEISPVKANYLLDQYSGGVGDIVLPMLTPEAESGDNTFTGNMIAPLRDKFTADSVMNNQNVSAFYDTMDKQTTNAKSSKATDEDVLKSKYLNAVSADMSDLYKQKREVQSSSLPDDEKYEQVRNIQQQIDELAENALSNYENISREGDYAEIGGVYFEWYTPEKGESYWRKLSDEQATKYKLTSKAGNAHYVTDGNVHYRLDEEGKWTKISDRQLERQNEVTKALGITPDEYWSKTDISFLPMSDGEYEYAFEHPDNYTVAKAVGGYDAYKTYSTELYNIKADKDKNGKSISGSRKEKVIDYVNNLDIDYGARLILFKSEYNADDTYNNEIIDYLNSREDISYEEMETILKELGFTVSSDGTISWD